MTLLVDYFPDWKELNLTNPGQMALFNQPWIEDLHTDPPILNLTTFEEAFAL